MTKDGNINNDEKALEALLAAAFRLDFPEELTEEQAEKFLKQPALLSQEDKVACNSWGTDFIEKLIQEEKISSKTSQDDIEANEELRQELFAMNRDKDGNDVDEEAHHKIEEERKKALEKEDKEQDDEA